RVRALGAFAARDPSAVPGAKAAAARPRGGGHLVPVEGREGGPAGSGEPCAVVQRPGELGQRVHPAGADPVPLVAVRALARPRGRAASSRGVILAWTRPSSTRASNSAGEPAAAPSPASARAGAWMARASTDAWRRWRPNAPASSRR